MSLRIPGAPAAVACATLLACCSVPEGARGAELELRLGESVGPAGTAAVGTFPGRLATALTEAGDRVIAGAPVLVLGQAAAEVTGAPGAFHARVRWSVRASRRDSAEIVASCTGEAEAAGPDAQAAAGAALTRAADQAAAELHQGLVAKGVARTEPGSISVRVRGVESYEMLGLFKDALGALPGVGAIEQRSFAGKTAKLEVACSCDGPALAAALPAQLTPTWHARVDEATPSVLLLTLVLGQAPAAKPRATPSARSDPAAPARRPAAPRG